MAIKNDDEFYESRHIEIGPKTASAIFYILIAIIAITISVPAALLSADLALF